jgi:hypothetical protein
MISSSQMVLKAIIRVTLPSGTSKRRDLILAVLIDHVKKFQGTCTVAVSVNSWRGLYPDR